MSKMNEWTNHSEDDSLLKSAHTRGEKIITAFLLRFIIFFFFARLKCLLACIWCYKYVTVTMFDHKNKSNLKRAMPLAGLDSIEITIKMQKKS